MKRYKTAKNPRVTAKRNPLHAHVLPHPFVPIPAPTRKEWLNWGANNSIDPVVLAWVEMLPGSLDDAFPVEITPRSCENLSFLVRNARADATIDRLISEPVRPRPWPAPDQLGIPMPPEPKKAKAPPEQILGTSERLHMLTGCAEMFEVDSYALVKAVRKLRAKARRKAAKAS